MEQRERNLFTASLKTVKGTKYGFINKQGEFVIKPVFDYALDFQENGLAIVEEQNRYGVINHAGRYVLKPTFQSINPYSEGRAVAMDDNGSHVINEKGQIITKKPYSFIGSFQEGRAVYSTKTDSDYLYGYLNLLGSEVIRAKYRFANDFQDGVALVQKMDGTYALINIEGKELHQYTKPFISYLGNGLLAFKEADDFEAKAGIMDTVENILVTPTYSWIQPFQDGRAAVNISDDYKNQVGLIDRTGKYYIKPKYMDIMMLGHNRVAVSKAISEEEPFLGANYAIATTNGEFLTDFNFTQVSPYENGYASVSDGKETYFVDKAGVKSRRYPTVNGEGTLTFEGELIQSLVDQRVTYFTRDGKLVWSQNKVIPLNKQYKVVEKKYQPSNHYLVYYPAVEGMMDEKAEQKLNETLLNLSKAEPTSEKQDYTYSADFNVEFYKEQLLVLEIDGYFYPLGAAHGMPSKETPSIHLTNGTIYELKDLFNPGSEYVKVLSDIIEKQIKTDDTYSYVFQDQYKGIKPNQPFYVNNDALFIYFAPYEIGPYAAGFPTFKIPFAEIMNMINKKGEFWQAFH
ncbi:WG repeat-containing protein [Bacillus salitolerans]|uniref:WG repeat-containing protein n=1 Tax=Bacillus salitolerans TaxID=1437434 RepID=A0ABW4LST2_9BACI